jgi:hypothetical protein
VNPPSEAGREDRAAGITTAELAAIGQRLEAFAADVFESLPRKDQRARGSATCAGCCWTAAASRSSRWPPSSGRCTTRRCTTSSGSRRGTGRRPPVAGDTALRSRGVPAPDVKTELRRAGLASPLRAHPAPPVSFLSPAYGLNCTAQPAPQRPRSPRSRAGYAWATALVSWLLPAGWPGAEVGRDRVGSGARQCATPSMTSASSLSGTAAACRVVR